MKYNPTYFNHHSQFIKFTYVKGVSLAEAVYASNLELPRHRHRHAGFCLTLQGEYTESNDNKLLECKPSYVKFNPAGDEHSNRYGKESVRIFVMEIKADWLDRMDVHVLLGNTPVVFRNKSIYWLMMRLRREFYSRDVESTIAIEGLTLELIAEASRNRAEIVNDSQSRWLTQAKNFLDERFNEPLDLAVIADCVGVHPVYLANSFRRHYQCSIGEYLRRRRIEFACHKISTSKDSLVDIALEAGFSNQSHFTRIFKQITGTTPSRFRTNR